MKNLPKTTVDFTALYEKLSALLDVGTMPLRICYVRHGESIGNIINALIRRRCFDQIPAQYQGLPTLYWPLSKLGLAQAQAASDWLDQHIGLDKFAVGFHSPYLRAVMTAGQIALPGQRWRENPFIRERDWGEMDFIATPEQYESHLEHRAGRSANAMGWLPPNGESMLAVPERIYWLFRTMTREHSNSFVLNVAHGESITAAMIMHERIPMLRASRMLEQKLNPRFDIPNCGIIEYTRINPLDKSDIRPKLTWVRHIDPTNPPDNPETLWEEIIRKRYSSSDLRELAAEFYDELM